MSRLKVVSGIVLGSLMVVLPFAGTATAVGPTVSYAGDSTTPFSIVSVSGSGFRAGESIIVSLGLSSTSAVADGAGNFSGASITIPALPSNLYIIVAVGQTSGLVGFTSIYVSSFFPVISPNSWYLAPGASLSWNGSGFAPNEEVTVANASGATIATFSTNSSGAFSNAGATTIPMALRNSTPTYTLHGNKSDTTLSVTITVSDLYPFVTPSTWYGVPGTQVSFTAIGFAPNETVHLYLGSGTTALARIAADAMGAFSEQGSQSLPFNTLVADYRFVGDQSGVAVAVPVTLAAFYPTLTASSYYAPPGTSITVGGSGFAAGEPVTLFVGETNAGVASTNAAGDFSPMSVALPATPNSTVSIRAVGAMSGAEGSFEMGIGQYYPNVSPSAWFTYSGNTVTFSGEGFAPNETVTMSGAGSGTATTDSAGAFSGLSARIPAGAVGTQNFTFTGSKSSAVQTIGIALGVRSAAIWFDNYYAHGGSPLTVFGAGFGNGEAVQLSANGATFASTMANASGDLSAKTAIPFAPAGELTITATGADTGAAASASLTAAPVYTNLQLDSYAVPAGSVVTFIGSGFLPNEPIDITTDRTGSTVVASFTADATGSFRNSGYIIPSDFSSGNLTVTARGGHSFTDTAITLWVIGQ